ncbi:MAG: YraN family protein [Clostridiales bacterium]|nr:YraN family protein [Clostridiales bacterium]
MTDKLTAYAKGILGEDAARKYLEAKGMVLLKQRYHSPYGEIDLVMRDGDVLAMVEVKTREKGTPETCAYAISPKKQQRLCMTARYFLAEYDQPAAVRFDAVLVTAGGILHIPNAFEGKEW